MSIDIKDVLFWIFLVISLGLLVWYVFGDSPTEFITLVAIIMTVLFKIWGVSDKVLKLETKFNFLVRDFKEHINHK